MRSRELAIGAIFLILGFIFFWHGYSTVQHYQSSLGQLALSYSEEAREKYQLAQGEATIGGIMTMGGFALCLYGAVAKPSKKEKSGVWYERHGLTWERKNAQEPKQVEEPVSEKTKEAIHCIYCGEKLPSVAVYCRKCGKKIEQS